MIPAIDHSILSPSGRVSKRTRKAALAREFARLFPDGFPEPTRQQPSERERYLRQAKELRELAARGFRPRKHTKEAERLERLALEADE